MQNSGRYAEKAGGQMTYSGNRNLTINYCPCPVIGHHPFLIQFFQGPNVTSSGKAIYRTILSFLVQKCQAH